MTVFKSRQLTIIDKKTQLFHEKQIFPQTNILQHIKYRKKNIKVSHETFLCKRANIILQSALRYRHIQLIPITLSLLKPLKSIQPCRSAHIYYNCPKNCQGKNLVKNVSHETFLHTRQTSQHRAYIDITHIQLILITLNTGKTIKSIRPHRHDHIYHCLQKLT